MKRTIPALLLLAACTGGADEPAPQPPAQEAPSLPPRAEARQDTILLEGMPEIITSHLYQAPASFPLPFSTYIPEGMAPETVSAEEGEAIRVVVEFGGRRNENAYLQITALPAGTTEAQAREIARSQAAEGIQPDDVPFYPWSIAEHMFMRGGQRGFVVGRLALGRHGGRYFTITSHYPAEYGDGLGPRIDYILRNWRWEDTGQGL